MLTGALLAPSHNMWKHIEHIEHTETFAYEVAENKHGRHISAYYKSTKVKLKCPRYEHCHLVIVKASVLSLL